MIRVRVNCSQFLGGRMFDCMITYAHGYSLGRRTNLKQISRMITRQS